MMMIVVGDGSGGGADALRLVLIRGVVEVVVRIAALQRQSLQLKLVGGERATLTIGHPRMT